MTGVHGVSLALDDWGRADMALLGCILDGNHPEMERLVEPSMHMLENSTCMQQRGDSLLSERGKHDQDGIVRM